MQNLVLLFSVIINLMVVIFLLKKEKLRTSKEEREQKPSNESSNTDEPNIDHILAIDILDEFMKETNEQLLKHENENQEILKLLNELNNKNEELRKYILNKEKEVVNAQAKKNKEPEDTDQNDIPIEDEKPEVHDLTENKIENLFLPSPFETNKFSVEDASKSKISSSLYCINLKTSSEQIGEILILENADFLKALNSPQQFLEPVCDYENAYSKNAKRVENIEKGAVKKEGDDWIVTKRMIIKFI